MECKKESSRMVNHEGERENGRLRKKENKLKT
jgi:hypothetical protein